MSGMLTKDEATMLAHSRITSPHPEVRDWEGLSEVLDELYDRAAQRAAFDHQMAVLSYQFVRAIDVTGPGLVAERLGISVKELAERIKPERIGDMTMSEQRLLALCVGVELSYEIIPTHTPEEKK